jgi:hypothetical protein
LTGAPGGTYPFSVFRAAWLVVCSVAVAVPAAARADAGGAPSRLAVHVYAAEGLSEADRAALTRAARDGAAAAAGYEVVAAEVARDHEAEAEAAVTRADSALEEGAEQARHFEHAAALERLQRAAAIYAEHLPALLVRDGNPDRMVQTHVQLAAIHYLEGDETAADAALRAAMVLDPDLTGAMERVPPQMREFVQTRQFLIDELGSGSVEVTAGSPGTTVYVNGIERGTAPVTVDELVPGPTLIHLQVAGGASLAITAAVEGGTTTAVEGTARPPESEVSPFEAARAEVGAARAGPGLNAAARTLVADAVLLIVPKAGEGGVELRAYVYDLRSDALVATGERTVATAELAGGAGALGRTAVSSAQWQPIDEVVRVDRKPLWRRVREHDYFWPAVGVTAGVVVLGLAIAVADGGLDNGTKIGILPVIEF